MSKDQINEISIKYKFKYVDDVSVRVLFSVNDWEISMDFLAFPNTEQALDGVLKDDTLYRRLKKYIGD